MFSVHYSCIHFHDAQSECIFRLLHYIHMHHTIEKYAVCVMAGGKSINIQFAYLRIGINPITLNMDLYCCDGMLWEIDVVKVHRRKRKIRRALEGRPKKSVSVAHSHNRTKTPYRKDTSRPSTFFSILKTLQQYDYYVMAEKWGSGRITESSRNLGTGPTCCYKCYIPDTGAK